MVDGKKARELNDAYSLYRLVGLPAGPVDRRRRSAPARGRGHRAVRAARREGRDRPRYLRRERPAGRRRPDGVVARSDGRGFAGRLQPAAAHRPGAAPRPGLVRHGAAPSGRVQPQPHPGLSSRGGTAALRVRLPVRTVVRVVPAARGANGARCWPSTVSWPASTRTCGRTPSPRSRSATTSGCWPSRPTICTASSISCGTCDRPRPGGTFAKRCRSTPEPGAASPRSSRCSRSGCRPARPARRQPPRFVILDLLPWGDDKSKITS